MHHLDGLHRFLPGAVAAAQEAGRVLRRSFHQKRRFSAKGPGDFVTSVDLRCEELLRRQLAALMPMADFWGEESGGNGASRGFGWVVDPLDGTTNFLHSYPHSAISLALTRGAEILLAVIHDPYRRETFRAVKGEGAWLGNHRLRVSTADGLDQSLVATGLPLSGPDDQALTAHYRAFQRICRRARGVRCDSCASLDLAYVAAGRFSAFWEVDLKPWDVAAGILLVTEAGGLVTDLRGQPLDWRRPSGDYLVTNGLVQATMVEELGIVE